MQQFGAFFFFFFFLANHSGSHILSSCSFLLNVNVWVSEVHTMEFMHAQTRLKSISSERVVEKDVRVMLTPSRV